MPLFSFWRKQLEMTKGTPLHDLDHRARIHPLVYQPRMIMVMNVEHALELVAEEIGVPGENTHPCNFAHQKRHMNWPGLEPRPLRWEAGS
jgi:hypothetical protein